MRTSRTRPLPLHLTIFPLRLWKNLGFSSRALFDPHRFFCGSLNASWASGVCGKVSAPIIFAVGRIQNSRPPLKQKPVLATLPAPCKKRADLRTTGCHRSAGTCLSLRCNRILRPVHHPTPKGNEPKDSDGSSSKNLLAPRARAWSFLFWANTAQEKNG